MSELRLTCPACRKRVEVTRPDVARPRANKGKDDPLELVRVVCPSCGRIIHLSRLRR